MTYPLRKTLATLRHCAALIKSKCCQILLQFLHQNAKTQSILRWIIFYILSIFSIVLSFTNVILKYLGAYSYSKHNFCIHRNINAFCLVDSNILILHRDEITWWIIYFSFIRSQLPYRCRLHLKKSESLSWMRRLNIKNLLAATIIFFFRDKTIH